MDVYTIPKGMIAMELRERYFQKIRDDKMRLTKSRRAMIEILENQHLTFKEKCFIS